MATAFASHFAKAFDGAVRIGMIAPMKVKTSITLSAETISIADSIAKVEERSRSFVLDKAILFGLEKMDSQAARSARRVPVKKPKKQI